MILEYFKKLWHHWKVLLKDSAFRWSLLLGLVLYFGSSSLHIYVSRLHDTNNFAPVGDAILNFLPTYNLEPIFTWGFYILIGLMWLYPIFFKPEITPFALKTFSMLVLVRLGFMVLTEIGPPAGFFYDGNFEYMDTPFNELIFRNDLFFSGHTAFPFLAYWIFRRTPFGIFMLIGTFVMALTALLMHVHYSIDVFAAFFITYGVYAMSDKIFNNLNLRFRERLQKYGWEAWKKKLLGEKSGVLVQQEKVEETNGSQKV